MHRRCNVDSKIYEYCLRCHRKLKNEEAKRIGYGKICYEKAKSVSNKNKLFVPIAKEHNM